MCCGRSAQTEEMSPLTKIHCDTDFSLGRIVKDRTCELRRSTEFNHSVIMLFCINTSLNPLVINCGKCFCVKLANLGIEFHTALNVDICNLVTELILAIVAVTGRLLCKAGNTMTNFFMRYTTIIGKPNCHIVMFNYSLMTALDNSLYKTTT